MGIAILPMCVMTVFWGIVGIGLPIMTPKGPHQSLIRCTLILTAVCCWLFWLCCYLAQMNPLIGPKLNQETIYMIAKKWGHNITDG